MKRKKKIIVSVIILLPLLLLLTYYIVFIRPQLVPGTDRSKVVSKYDGASVNYLSETNPDQKDVTMGEGTYALGKNSKGDIIFVHPKKAMIKIEKDCADYINEVWSDAPKFRNSWRCAWVRMKSPYGKNGELTAHYEEERNMMLSFLEYYGNMYDPKVREPGADIKYFPDKELSFGAFGLGQFGRLGFGEFVFYRAI